MDGRRWRVSAEVLRALAVGLGQRADLFDPAVSPDPEVLVKIIRYPAPDGHDGGGEARRRPMAKARVSAPITTAG